MTDKENNLVTKTDLKNQVDNFNNQIDKLINRIEKNNNEQIKWTIGVLIAFALLFFSSQSYIIYDIKEDIASQNTRLDKIDAKFENLDAKLENLRKNIEGFTEEHVNVTEKINNKRETLPGG